VAWSGIPPRRSISCSACCRRDRSRSARRCGAAGTCHRLFRTRCCTIRRPGSGACWRATLGSTHAGLTERQRASIDIDVTVAEGDGDFGISGTRCGGIPHRHDPAPDLTDATRWARSVNPLLRRRAARNAELPADVVNVLAQDPDLGVRVLLAQHHPAAPAALLLRSYLEYRGCGRDRLSALPQFPTEGLAGFADHDDPAVRRLVALDPDAAQDVVARLLHDADHTVRQAMASCPRLPAHHIAALLDNPELAEAAATNPALPVPQMWSIVDRNA